MLLSYDVQFNNTGNAVAKLVWINLTIPSGLLFVGDTSSSVTGVDLSERIQIGYWLFQGVGIGEHNFKIFLKANQALPDGYELTTLFSMEYIDVDDVYYGSVLIPIKSDFKRPVIDISVEVDNDYPKPGDKVIFTINFSNTGSVNAGQVIIDFLAIHMDYVDDNITDLNGIQLDDFRYSLTNLGKGFYSIEVVTALDNEITSNYANTTIILNYTDPTGTVMWNVSYIVRLTVDVSGQFIPSKPYNALPILIAVIAMLSLSSAFFSENFKYWFFWLFVPLYTKLRKKDILEHETRGLIRGYIIANPGDHFNSIKKALDLNNGTLAYHLHVLEREEVIKSKRWGKFTRFYPSGMKIPENGSKYSEIQKLIIEKIRETQGVTQKEIASMIGVTKSTINYHVNRLVTDGVVEGRRLGIQIRYFYVDNNKKT